MYDVVEKKPFSFSLPLHNSNTFNQGRSSRSSISYRGNNTIVYGKGDPHAFSSFLSDNSQC